MKNKLIIGTIFFILVTIFWSIQSFAASKGELLRWEKVNGLLPKYSIFTVLDLETGQTFKVQRRAGSSHADVQPLTTKDTTIMKKIYNGKWSWRRRAIIVSKGDRSIAASMHGMPHGAGALQNNFPGHFCIHFYGSTTHRSNKMDLSHKLMVLKSSGQLEKHLEQASAEEVAYSFISGIKEHDQNITTILSANNVNWARIFKKVENVRIQQSNLKTNEEATYGIETSVPINIDWYFEETGRENFTGTIKLIRTSHFDGWKVDAKDFLKKNKLLVKQKKQA